MTPFGYTILGFGAGGTADVVNFLKSQETAFGDGGAVAHVNIAFDDNNAGVFVVAYCDTGGGSGGTITAAVGTVADDGSVTFGSAVHAYSGGDLVHQRCRLDFDKSTSGKFVINYNLTERHGGGIPNFICGIISGTGGSATITFGSAAAMPYGPAHPSSVWHATQGDLAVTADGTYMYYAGYDQGSSNQGRSSRWDIASGTGTTIDNITQLGQHDVNGRGHVIERALDDTDSALLMYTENGANLIVRRLTSGSLGTRTEVTSNGDSEWDADLSCNPNSTGKFVVHYSDQANSNYGTVRVGVLSGDAISYGTALVVHSQASDYQRCNFDHGTETDQVVLLWVDQSSGENHPYGMVCTVNADNTITAGDLIDIGTDGVNDDLGLSQHSIDCDPNTPGSFVYGYNDNDNSNIGYVNVGSLPV